MKNKKKKQNMLMRKNALLVFLILANLWYTLVLIIHEKVRRSFRIPLYEGLFQETGNYLVGSALLSLCCVFVFRLGTWLKPSTKRNEISVSIITLWFSLLKTRKYFIFIRFIALLFSAVLHKIIFFLYVG